MLTIKNIQSGIKWLGIFLTCYSLIIAIFSDISFDFIWILPAVFVFFSSKYRIEELLVYHLGISLLYFILFVRYIYIPLFSMRSGIYFMSFVEKTSSSENTLTILLMTAEAFVILYTLRRYRRSLLNYRIKIKNNDYFQLKSKTGLYLILFLGILSFMIFPAIRERTQFLWAAGFGESHLTTISAVGMIFTQLAIYAFFLVSIINYKKKKTIQRYLLMIASSVMMISTYWSESRTYVAIMGIATVATLKRTKAASTKTLSLISITTILAVVSLSGYQMFKDGNVGDFQKNFNSKITTKGNQLTQDYLQAYFGGNHLISTTIAHSGFIREDLDPIVFLNEIAGSMFFIRQVFPPLADQTTTKFNILFGHDERNSMIIPMLGQSYIYFGIIGSFFLSLIAVRILIELELAYLKSRNLDSKLILLIGTIWLGLFPMQNINIISGSLFNVFFIGFIVFKLSSKIRFN